MKKINLARLKWARWQSPKGKFAQFGKDISGALGDVRRGWPKQGHPFNLELVKVPPGKAACPFHSHTTQWEMFVILSGSGTVRADRKRHQVGPGDAFMHPPGEAHQIINTGKEDLVFYIIADNPPVDIFHYPDSGKWGMRPQGKFFRMKEMPYHAGEE
ncbi:MAG: cupin domain-containing protein [Opitutae bacterium]|nr:cupin domain-containing protein [Opitutae bacterium]